MSKVTSKLQLTLPKALAEQYGIEPGDEVTWLPAGESLRLLPPRVAVPAADPARRLKLFDAATERQSRREKQRGPAKGAARGWTREDLYGRGRAR
jgi:bifunctional DNA-binding transcriptional regulator/antitoxin component of YhaV-PrlF toxin-antitoxin module